MSPLRGKPKWKPVPAKPKPAPRKAGRVVKQDGRVVCKTPYQWQKVREVVCQSSGATCDRCNRPAPLHDVIHPDTGQVMQKAGEAHHIRARKMGGGSRDDRPQNLMWLCWMCHFEEHVPKKVVPRKQP